MRTIRELRKQDASVLAEIEQRSFPDAWSLQVITDLLTHSYTLTLVALEQDRPVAYVTMNCLGEEGSIDRVLVDREYRGRGIARQLMTELMEQGKCRGVRDFTLEVRVSNTPAIRLYEGMGFVSEGIRPHFYEHPTEDANILWCRT